MGPQDRMLLGMDAHEDITEIWTSYHDSQGICEKRRKEVIENTEEKKEEKRVKRKEGTGKRREYG